MHRRIIATACARLARPLLHNAASTSPRLAAAAAAAAIATPTWARRSYAFQAAAPPLHQVFNRRTKWLQKERAAADVESSRTADYLKDEVAIRLCERLLDIKRTYPKVLDLGANSCNVARALVRPDPDPRISHLTAAESSETLLYRDADLPFNSEINMTREVLADEETLPYPADTFDLVLSSLALHWINDLPGVLAQINNILKPDCAFMGAMFGGDTLFELRTSLQLAEQERRGGISPHVSPLADVRDVGGLLGKAGFKMLTVDVDDIIVDYPDMFALMQDLQAMGESSAVLGREMGAIQRDVLLAGEAIYRALHGNEDGSLPATFRMIYMIGWKEGGDQAQPLPRGSGQINLKDVLQSS
ncbi:S-adenosyl-L-methionine-dependent methyltransferase [Microdochium trichocladiopsis]|uniref:S-adenosyl-L-methionine-dependent methyltransferase n=1 Tax=Microdochium trichocladiopsis TaxID=1682393 RepID=A0A9P8XW42_9PEZI|nr:S-adenosyl-L-methionine-dependent methyltransferase [Microdochium trichocladiopsis]KAH7021258.1 S-adenosyl-L-methionine-dependent methyltransferase [Microdochium trichocladiopsis]